MAAVPDHRSGVPGDGTHYGHRHPFQIIGTYDSLLRQAGNHRSRHRPPIGTEIGHRTPSQQIWGGRHVPMHARDLVPLASRYEADARYAILHPTGMRHEIGLGRNRCRRSGTGADSAWNGCRQTLEGLTVYVGIIRRLWSITQIFA